MPTKKIVRKTPRRRSQSQSMPGMRWNLKLLYSSPRDPQIEKDVRAIEAKYDVFAKKYDTPGKEFLTDPAVLLQALKDFEAIAPGEEKPILYFYYLRDIDATDEHAVRQMALLENRYNAIMNKANFFYVLLGKMPEKRRKSFLADRRLARYRVFLERQFADARHVLSVAEEKIMGLKSLPAVSMWISGNEKLLNIQTVSWKGKAMPVSEAIQTISKLRTQKERAEISSAVLDAFKRVAPFSEAELNAIITNKKIDDELRGDARPYDATVRRYRNDPKVVETLVRTVTGSFPIAHRFYKLKAKLLKEKKLLYSDRAAHVGEMTAKFDFEKSVKIYKDVLEKLDPKLKDIFEEFLANGQIDVPPRVGKRGGAYCSGSYGLPTFVLINHTPSLNSFTTLAHEMGHAFHTELSKSQGPIYCNYSTALAETASTLFESIALDAVFDSLPEKEKVIVLHDKIQDAIATIMRQIACFNYENELHASIREKGFMSKEEMADTHNKHMQAYLGPVFKMQHDDGYYFVHWSHIRRFFYVYTYAYGMLVSMTMRRRYKADPSFWAKIEEFLSSGGNDSPENILRKIGIDVLSPEFWKEGLKEIEDDIEKLEKLAAKKK